MASLVINPGLDFFSKSSQSNETSSISRNPFAFRPSAQVASNIASVVNQQATLSKEVSKPPHKSKETTRSTDSQRSRSSASPVERHISTTSKLDKIKNDTKLLKSFGVSHLRGRARRRMVKRCKKKLRAKLQQGSLPDHMVESFIRQVLKNAPTSSAYASAATVSGRQTLNQQIETYLNEPDSSSQTSDDTSSEQASRAPSPLQDAGATMKRELEKTADESPITPPTVPNGKDTKRKVEKEVKGIDDKKDDKKPTEVAEKKDEKKQPETADKKKRKADDEPEHKELTRKERRAMKKAKRAAAAKDTTEHKFADAEEAPAKRKEKEVVVPTPPKKAKVEETKAEVPMTKPPKAGRINIRGKIPKNQMPKVFQALYDDIPDTFKLSKTWKELPRSILSGKTAGSGNISNYCYFNTAMQMLSHIAPLVQYLVYYHSQKQCPIARDDRICVCCEVRDFILRSYEDQRDGFYILKRLGFVLEKRFRTSGRYHEQQDSNDVMLSILEKAISQLKTQQDSPKASTPIEEIFSFKSRSTVICKSCHYKSVEETDTLLHIMDIPQGRNELPLMEAYKPSTTDTISGYKCSKCKKSVEITKRNEIATLPPYLLILTTRNVVFTMPSFGRRGGKKGRRGEVESDPRRVVVPPTRPTVFTTSEGRKETYAFSGVAIHQGSSHHGGHWVHLGRLPNGEWATHSDRHVSSSPQLHFPKRGGIGVVFGFSRS